MLVTLFPIVGLTLNNFSSALGPPLLEIIKSFGLVEMLKETTEHVRFLLAVSSEIGCLTVGEIRLSSNPDPVFGYRG
jgi:hypothetical protein